MPTVGRTTNSPAANFYYQQFIAYRTWLAQTADMMINVAICRLYVESRHAEIIQRSAFVRLVFNSPIRNQSTNHSLIALFPLCPCVQVLPQFPTADHSAGSPQGHQGFEGVASQIFTDIFPVTLFHRCASWSNVLSTLVIFRGWTTLWTQEAGGFIITSITKALINNEYCFQPKGSHQVMF